MTAASPPSSYRTAPLRQLMEATFRDCVIEEQHDGRTILLSSHILAGAEALR